MMKKIVLACLGLAFMGFGCSSTTSPTKLRAVTPAATSTQTSVPASTTKTTAPDFTVSDFTPPTGEATNPPPASAGERRLLTATSTDGIHFTSTGKVFTEQGNVPDAVVTADGTIFAYYIGQGIEQGKETTAVAVSKDNGSTWVYKFLVLNKWPSNRAPSDPDVVLRPDGTFRMYFTNDVSTKNLGIAYGDSTDGITFTYKGVALDAGYSLNDSTTMYFDGLWHMYVLDEKKPPQLHATSSDGATFALASPSLVSLPKPEYYIVNPLIENNVFRMFGFSLNSEKNIRSFTTTDGVNWIPSEVALDATDAVTAGSGYLQDSTVVKLADGTYLMIYVVGYAK